MVNIKFIPENDTYINAAEEYQKIWREEGKMIITRLEEISGLPFLEKEVETIVLEGVSHSGKANLSPMKLRASNPYEQKKATLIHELGHRLLSQYKIWKNDLGTHQILYLILYDILFDLYGKDFADHQVEIESSRKNPVAPYKKCWQWALSKTRNERKSFFDKIVHDIAN